MKLSNNLFIEKWPNWLRWILFLPASVIIPFIFAFIQNFFIYNFSGLTSDYLIVELYNGFVMGAGFIFVGAIVAPKKQVPISIILQSLLTAICLIMYLLAMQSSLFDGFRDTIFWLLVVGSGIFAVYIIYESERKEEPLI